jgi:ketosteroid isomerase-like protein
VTAHQPMFNQDSLQEIMPAALARTFIAAYAVGDRDAMLALCARDATTLYIPWGSAGENAVSSAVDVWRRYPAAFHDFAMPITSVHEDVAQRTAIVATLNSGIQRENVDGIVSRGGTMSCPHLFVIAFDERGLITSVEVWCDQLTLYRQLGFPSGFEFGGQS